MDRPFKDAFGHTVDLDDDKTYKNLPKTDRELDDKMFEEIGKALVYMDYFHPDVFPSSSPQRLRVNQMIYNFATERRGHYKDVKWLREKLYIFQDETENMC